MKLNTDLAFEESEEFTKIFEDVCKKYFDLELEIFFQTYVEQKSFYDIKTALISRIKGWQPSKKINFLIFLVKIFGKTAQEWDENNENNIRTHWLAYYSYNVIVGLKFKVTESDVSKLYNDYKKLIKDETLSNGGIWFLSYIVTLIKYTFPPSDLPLEIKNLLEDIIHCDHAPGNWSYTNEKKLLVKRINNILYIKDKTEDENISVYYIGEDEFKKYANDLLDAQNENEKLIWFQILALAQKVSGGKPTQIYLDDSKNLITALGSKKFKEISQKWYQFIIEMKETIKTLTAVHNDYEYEYNEIKFLSAENSNTIKGIVWMNSLFHDSETIQTLSKLAERCFKTIPEKGPAAAGIGNACIYALYASKGLSGIAQLSKLKLKIRQNNTISLIEKYIEEAAAKLNISAHEIEDLSVSDFNIQERKVEFPLGTFICLLELTGIGKSTLRWLKEDGTEQKTLPKAVKDKFAAKLKKIRDLQKQINQTTSSLKERFDRMLRINRSITLEYLNDTYLKHPIFAFVIDKMIFRFSIKDKDILAIFLNHKWETISGEQISINEFTTACLWHPVTSSIAEVQDWRQYLIRNQIQQPFKQAFREIYLITEAELRTKNYSNRMASHILKQHQYANLAKGRNWTAKLIGYYDYDQDLKAKLNIPEQKIRVEYRVNPVQSENEHTEAGIWKYISTDQISFYNSETNQVIDLIDVPSVVFSEAMRDADLFVGVASVGNDPQWRDSGGLPVYRDYWESYSFGDLSEIAKNRKEILQGLIPRLKISAVTHIENNFVIVKGSIRTYKIHIGSTNILMEPNDQYLCIVPESKKIERNDDIFLPFAGDYGLSVIISKAFLLAEDDKISDSTIMSQIHYK